MIDYAKEYDNSGRVENSAALIDGYISNAIAFRERGNHHAHYDLAYGPQDRNRLDMFWPDTSEGKEQRSPIVMFIHGGYWQRLDRTAFSHMAQGLNASGIAVAIPSYTLCPDITIGGIVMEMRRACLMVYQTYKRPITVIGHSAGGHLAACMMATDWHGVHPDLPPDMVQSGMGISGLYDLLPLLKTPINEALRLDEPHAIDNSPVRWVPEALQQFEAWVGGDESDEYHRQSRDLATRWTMLGTSTAYVPVAGENHFTIIHALQDKNSAMVQRIVELVRKPSATTKLHEPDEDTMAAALAPWDAETEDADQDATALFEDKVDAENQDEIDGDGETFTGDAAHADDQKSDVDAEALEVEPRTGPSDTVMDETEDLTDLPSTTHTPSPSLAMPEGLDVELEFDENWEAVLAEQATENQEIAARPGEERNKGQERKTTAPEKK
ncbi:MAG: alpha/beta hydrolase fold domain-containing protein [Pseudomonadota bacterium]